MTWLFESLCPAHIECGAAGLAAPCITVLLCYDQVGDRKFLSSSASSEGAGPATGCQGNGPQVPGATPPNTPAPNIPPTGSKYHQVSLHHRDSPHADLLQK